MICYIKKKTDNIVLLENDINMFYRQPPCYLLMALPLGTILRVLTFKEVEIMGYHHTMI